MRVEVLTVMKMFMVVWVVLDSNPEDGGNMLLRNVDTCPHYVTTQKISIIIKQFLSLSFAQVSLVQIFF